MDFKIKDGEQIRTVIAEKADATVIEAGDIVGITAGLIVKAGATTAEIAYCPKGAGAGTTEIEVTVGNDFTLVGTADANFAKANRGAEVDLVLSGDDQQIDIGASATDVFKVGLAQDSGTVGSATDVEVRINKPLF